MRERNIRRSIHNFSLLSQALGDKDDDLAALVDSSNRVFKAFADQDANLRAGLQELPGALDATNTTLAKVDKLGQVLGPTLGALRPGARALGPALVQTRPFLTRRRRSSRTSCGPSRAPRCRWSRSCGPRRATSRSSRRS